MIFTGNIYYNGRMRKGTLPVAVNSRSQYLIALFILSTLNPSITASIAFTGSTSVTVTLVTEYKLENGNTVDSISDVRLLNLAAGQGHPVEIMDLSFALQALTAEYIVKNHESLSQGVRGIPPFPEKQLSCKKLHRTFCYS